MSTTQDDLLEVLKELAENADSMQRTFGIKRGRTPEHEDICTHDEWAEGPLKESVSRAQVLIAKCTAAQKEPEKS